MTYIEWNPKFSVGEPILDADHRHLVELLNHFSDQLGPSRSNANIIDHLVQLYTSASKHFAREEAIMQAHGYSSDYVKHYADHQRLLNEITFVMFEFQYGSTKDNSAITQWVYNWFHEHHTTHDARLRRSLQKHIARGGPVFPAN
jgi:hemerythrin-like metal-binding protein